MHALHSSAPTFTASPATASTVHAPSQTRTSPEPQNQAQSPSSRVGSGRWFVESTTEEVKEVFSKIRQKGSVAEYQELKSQVMLSLPHLPESYYISIFTSRLKKEIKSIVKIVRPNFESQAFEIALLQENTITALNKTSKFQAYLPTQMV